MHNAQKLIQRTLEAITRGGALKALSLAVACESAVDSYMIQQTICRDPSSLCGRTWQEVQKATKRLTVEKPSLGFILKAEFGFEFLVTVGSMVEMSGGEPSRLFKYIHINIYILVLFCKFSRRGILSWIRGRSAE